MSSDYPAFQKIPRLFRDIVITEKIDGTNGLISVEPDDYGDTCPGTPTISGFVVRAGSRSRWVSPSQDNFGFAAWVYEHAEKLSELGPGLHYGEWWGAGIQRRYGLTGNDKRFSLFNTGRWHLDNIPAVPGLGVVPVLYEGPQLESRGDYDWDSVSWALRHLDIHGSKAAPGFMKPEGVVIYHTAARTYSKATIENDAAPKGNVA